LSAGEEKPELKVVGKGKYREGKRVNGGRLKRRRERKQSNKGDGEMGARSTRGC